jgi:hypothetical protein
VSSIGNKTFQLLGLYLAFILATIIAGFLGSAVGIWAAIAWIVTLVVGAIWFVVQRRGKS